MPNEDTNTTTPWTSESDTLLESLTDIFEQINPEQPVSSREDIPRPWQPGHELLFSSYGGQRSLERRRISVAAKGYTNRITGNLDINVTGKYNTIIQGGETSITLAPSADDDAGEDADRVGRLLADAPVTPGADKLHVKGDATVYSKQRQYIMASPGSGISINRKWHGKITKIAGMEGVISAGYSQVNYIGANLQAHLIASGDVYGGAARTAAARINIGAMTYRSLDYSVWALGVWARMCSFVIYPPVGPEGVGDKKGKRARKWAGRIIGVMCPALEILGGLGAGIWGLLKGLAQLIKAARHPKRNFKQMKSRLKTENHAVLTRTTSSDVST